MLGEDVSFYRLRSQDWENKKNAGVEENAGTSHYNLSQHEML